MLRVVRRVDQRGLDLGEVGDRGVGGVPGELHPIVQVPLCRSGLDENGGDRQQATGHTSQISTGTDGVPGALKAVCKFLFCRLTT